MAICNFVAWCLFGYLTLNQVFMLTVPDPCPSGIDPSTLGDMCTDKTAIEDVLNNDEINKILNSVVLRVTTQMSNCRCNLSIENQLGLFTVYMGKYNMLSSSAPVVSNCGLAIDVDYPVLPGIEDDGTRPPIECTTGLDLRSITLASGSSINFTSRIINGSFTRGYCMLIFRQHSEGDTASLKLTCEHHGPSTRSSTSVASGPDASSTETQISTIKPDKEVTMTMSKSTTDEDPLDNRTQQTTLPIESGNIEDKSSTYLQKGNMLYIIIGACGGFVPILVTTITTILCKRKTSVSKKNKNVSIRLKNDNRESDVVDYGLKDNMLYVSAEEDVHLAPNNSSTNYDGNYSMVDLNGHPLNDNKDVSDLTYSSVCGESQDNKPKFLPKSTVDSNLAYVSDNDAKSNRIIKQEKRPSDVYAVVDKSSKVGKTNCPETGIKTDPVEQ